MTRATVEGLRQGLHRSPFHGYSAEFSQYRHYRPGDDLKYVDWKAFARTDRLYTRQFRETTNLAAMFVIDVSRSMDFPTRDQGGRDQGSGGSKFALARTIAAILGTLVLDQGDAAGVLAVASARTSCRREAGIITCACCWPNCRGWPRPARRAIEQALRRAATLMKRRGVVIVVSDFYEDEGGHHADAAAAPHGPRRDRDPRAVEGRIVAGCRRRGGVRRSRNGTEAAGAAVERARVLRPRVGAWLATVERQVRRDGMDYLRVITGEPLEPALRRFLISARRRR